MSCRDTGETCAWSVCTDVGWIGATVFSVTIEYETTILDKVIKGIVV